ncbi:MAG: putative oxidoreductase [Herbinix sp.]|nr:putative oxidoreductase [Herbinix sp.]
MVEKFSGIDYLINNACLSKKGILSDCSYEDFNYVLRIGVTAPYQLAKLFLPYFNKKAGIVNISSTRAFMSQEDTESYTAAKGGITALTHALSVSLSGKVRVNSIAPGWIDTLEETWSKEDQEQHPVKRIGRPVDIAKMAMFLCSEDSGFITGENITIDGGMTKNMIYHNDLGWTYNSERA